MLVVVDRALGCDPINLSNDFEPASKSVYKANTHPGFPLEVLRSACISILFVNSPIISVLLKGHCLPPHRGSKGLVAIARSIFFLLG